MPDNAPSDTCCPAQPCLTLGQYTVMSDRYFTTGSTFVFLAGNHSLHTVLSLANVSDTTLRGIGNNSTASIVFSNNATIRCKNVSSFVIEGLAFLLCKCPCKEESTLQFLDSDQIIISNSIFRGGEVGGEVRSICSQHSNMTVLKCLFQGNRGPIGGALKFTRESKVNIDRSKFIGNYARGSEYTESSGMGGAISIYNSIATLSRSSFTRNSAANSGGAISANYGSTVFLEGNTMDSNTGGVAGGAVYCKTCTVKMRGNNTFRNNSVRLRQGGAVTATAAKVVLESGNTIFSGNKAPSGGAIAAVSRSILSCHDGVTVVLDSNQARDGGGLKMSSNSQSIGCEMRFINNIATNDGGGVSIGKEISYPNSKQVVLSGYFENNSAKRGSAVSIKMHSNIALRHADIVSNSAHAVYVYRSNATFKATRFVNNSGMLGGAVRSSISALFFEEGNVFAGNSALSGGAIHVTQGTVSFAGGTRFEYNLAKKNGGAIYAAGTVIHLNNSVTLASNSAYNGGAIYLNRQSFMTLNYRTHFTSSFNAALGYGGGIYHVDNMNPSQCGYNQKREISESSHCLLKFKTKQIRFTVTNISISSYADSARKDGAFLYGGLLDRCKVNHDYTHLIHHDETMLEYLDIEYLDIRHIMTITSKDNTTQALTSRPYGLCFCDGPTHRQDCIGSRSVVTHRGQKFTVTLLAIAQGSSVASTSVTTITSSTARLKLLQNPQHLPRYCSNLDYNLYSTKENEVVVLYPEGPCNDTGNARVAINITLLPCPDGFILAPDGHCVCEERLRLTNVSCIIDEDVHLTRKAGSAFWMGAKYVDGSYKGLILYKLCPVEYCRTDEVNMTLHDLDTQCVEGRIGVLCGGCAENYSLLIGSSKCKECSNTYLVLLLPFAAAGIALVAFLSILRLTVATGMINSLILYANIVQVNRKLFFPANTVNILTVFIAWLNLDLGFEMCFYDGMDAFAQTCLQFAFPVYVWVLISLIILTSRYSITVSKLIGHNPIAVLATLLLMSYTKVLKIIIEVYSSVKLDYPQSKMVTVWLKDANVPYLHSKHLALTVLTSLVLIFLFLPYTLLLLLGHKLCRLSGRKHFHWLNNLKPLLDSYYAPYKIHARYWTGFLLLVRCALYIVFSLGGIQESLLAIIISFTAVGFAVGFVRIYTQLANNILEAAAYMNLVTLSALSLADIAHKTDLANTLITMMLITTVGVISYHIYATYMQKSMIMLKLKSVMAPLFATALASRDSPAAAPTAAAATSSHKNISKTVIELREPLLES